MNQRPSGYEPDELPNCSTPRYLILHSLQRLYSISFLHFLVKGFILKKCKIKLFSFIFRFFDFFLLFLTVKCYIIGILRRCIYLDKLISDFRVWLSERVSKNTMRILRPFLTLQFFIFMGLGIVNTASVIIVATALDIIKNITLDTSDALRVFIETSRVNFIIGYIASIVLSFFLNSKYTFHQKPTLRNFIKFPISYIPNFLFQYIMVFMLTSIHWNHSAAYLIAAILGTPITFISMKLMVFRKKS